MMILEHFMNKLSVVLSTAWGWVVCVGLIVANFLAGYETMVGFTVVAVVMDAAWGIASSVKQGRFTNVRELIEIELYRIILLSKTLEYFDATLNTVNDKLISHHIKVENNYLVKAVV